MIIESYLNAASLVIIALITVFGSIQVAKINKIQKDTIINKTQLINDHISNPNKINNLRENIDYNNNAINEKLDNIIDTQRRQSNKIDSLFTITNKHSAILNKIKGE